MSGKGRREGRKGEKGGGGEGETYWGKGKRREGRNPETRIDSVQSIANSMAENKDQCHVKTESTQRQSITCAGGSSLARPLIAVGGILRDCHQLTQSVSRQTVLL